MTNYQNPRDYSNNVRPVRDSFTVDTDYINSRQFVSSENVDDLNAYLFRNGSLINGDNYYLINDGTNDVIYVDSTGISFIEGDIFVIDYLTRVV